MTDLSQAAGGTGAAGWAPSQAAGGSPAGRAAGAPKSSNHTVPQASRPCAVKSPGLAVSSDRTYI